MIALPLIAMACYQGERAKFDVLTSAKDEARGPLVLAFGQFSACVVQPWCCQYSSAGSC